MEAHYYGQFLPAAWLGRVDIVIPGLLLIKPNYFPDDLLMGIPVKWLDEWDDLQEQIHNF